jgi:glycosyltransferase involved in cell wall biosynthesis
VESIIGIEKPKKVAWFTDRYHGMDGVVVTVKKYLEASFEYNCDMTLVIADKDTENHPKGVKAFPAITSFILPMYNHIELQVPSFLKVARWLEEGEFDAVVISTPGPMGFAGMISAKALGLPVAAIYHTDLPRYAHELTGDGMFAGVVAGLTKGFYNLAEQIMVPSQHYAEELGNWGIRPDKISLMKRWVDTRLFSPEKRSNNGYFGHKKGIRLLYVGRISKEKNLDVLLQAHSHLSRLGEEFLIYCVGDGPYRDQLIDKTKTLDNFELPGPLYGEDLAKIYASADIFIFPSIKDTFGNVVLEAQASGLPCVVMNQGGPKEIVVHGKSGIVARNETEFISAIKKLMVDRDLRSSMSEAAVFNSYQFDKEKIFMKFWRDVTGENTDGIKPDYIPPVESLTYV